MLRKRGYAFALASVPQSTWKYRRCEIASQILDLLVKETKKRGVSQISLEATDMGRLLYEKFGFVKMENEMELIEK